MFAEERYLYKPTVFAATAVLFPDVEPLLVSLPPIASNACLELYNPLTLSEVTLPCGNAPLATDVSAPFAFHAVGDPTSDGVVSWFVNPSHAAEEGLFALAPYEPGKIPVVFVHGLLSSPRTWVDLANDLRVVPGFNDCFQVWAFRYNTGQPFLAAAARLRQDLDEIVRTVDPEGKDPALRHMVLLGHSMGGLVSKLQVVDSQDELWRAVANRPLEQINADLRSREELAKLFFFGPRVNVRRVVMIATPHRGSPWAKRPVGKLAAHCVRTDPETRARFHRLTASNPGVFSSGCSPPNFRVAFRPASTC
jgi:pimeloyl-ACP methyl ester carboxylesterase